MKQFTEQQLEAVLIEAYKRGALDGRMARWAPNDAHAAHKLQDLVHADAGGYDSKGNEV